MRRPAGDSKSVIILMGRQLLALTHFLVDVNEVLEIRAPETEVSGFDHCLVLEGVPDPLRQDDARTGLITVLVVSDPARRK